MQQPTVRDLLGVVIGGGLGMLALVSVSLWIIDMERKAHSRNRPPEDRWIVAASLVSVYVFVSVIGSWAIASGAGTALLAATAVPLAGMLVGVAMLRKSFTGARRSPAAFVFAAWLLLGGIIAIVLAVQWLMVALGAPP